MDRNYIVELIKDNRLQEALNAIEKASQGSHLHNQAIMLSSAYAEYAQANRTATQDFQTLEMQRAKITNSLLSFLDELSPEDFDKASARKQTIQYTPEPTFIDKVKEKWYWYAGGALVLFIIIGTCNSSDSPEVTTIKPNTTEVSTNETPSVNNQNGQSEALTGLNARAIYYSGGRFTLDDHDASWLDTKDDGQATRYKETSIEKCCVSLRDESRKMTVELDLVLKRGHYYYDNSQSAEGWFAITGAE